MMNVTIHRAKPVTPPPETVDITGIPYLTARVLLAVCDSIGGRQSGPRGHTDALANVLREIEPARIKISAVAGSPYLDDWEEKP